MHYCPKKGCMYSERQDHAKLPQSITWASLGINVVSRVKAKPLAHNRLPKPTTHTYKNLSGHVTARPSSKLSLTIVNINGKTSIRFFFHSQDSTRPKVQHTQLNLFRPSTNPSSINVAFSPTAQIIANNHGGWKVSTSNRRPTEYLLMS